MVNVGAPTVREMIVFAVINPAVPVIVTVYVPGAAELLAAMVIELPFVAGFVAKEAVTPAGSPEADRVTAPLKPY